jgi:hypothetical protein
VIRLDNAVLHAEIELEACSGEVTVNGIPVVTLPEALPSFMQSVPVNPLVVAGLNALELAVGLDPEAPSVSRRARRNSPSLSSAARAVARLVRYPLEPGTFASPEMGDVLVRLEWSAAEDTSEASPRELRATVDLGEGFGRWSWQDAPPLSLEGGTRLEVIGVLEEIRAAIRAGDAEALLRLIAIKFREVGAAYPGASDAASEAKDRENLAVWLGQFAAAPERVLPLDLDALDLRLAAEQRILIPTTRRFTSAIELKMAVDDEDGTPRGDVEVPYEVKLARIDGKLAVVR